MTTSSLIGPLPAPAASSAADATGARFPISGPAPKAKVRRRPDQDTDLEHIISSPAAFRVLRALTFATAPMTPPAIAKQSGVALMSVHRTIAQLKPLGLVEALGEGRVLLYRLPEKHAAKALLTRIFRWVAGDETALQEHSVHQGANR